jgi:hypothetical protein
MMSLTRSSLTKVSLFRVSGSLNKVLANQLFKRTAMAICITTVISSLLSSCATSSLSRDEEAKAATSASLPDLPSQWASIQQRVGEVKVSWL